MLKDAVQMQEQVAGSTRTRMVMDTIRRRIA